jgi:ComF family protein
MQLAYKYRKRSDLAVYLGQLLGGAILGKLDPSSVDAIVPIPTTWWRAMRFGPPPVTAMARQVSKRTRIPAADVLRVKEKRRRQQGLSATQRWRNVKGKFGFTAGSDVEGATLCLVDDVATTGATLSEAAKVLVQHGAGQVYAAVITKTDLSRPEVIPSPTSQGSSG